MADSRESSTNQIFVESVEFWWNLRNHVANFVLNVKKM